MKDSYFLLRLFLTIFCIANLVLGAIGFFANEESVEAIASLYGASVIVGPQLVHVARILGAFVFVMGILALFAIVEPVKNKRIIDGVVILLILRVAQRVIFAQQIHEAFGIAAKRNLINAGFFLVIALILFLLKPKESAF